MKKILSVCIFIFLTQAAFATHNRAGEITYKWLGGFKYGVTVTTYTNTYATTADRCDLVIYFGDGDSASAPRTNGPSSLCPLSHDGVMIASSTKLNVYYTEHIYPGPGNYIITMEDPNRNAGICNIPNSVNQSFFIRTELVISPFLPPNSSPILLNPPIDNACVGQCFEHNPGAYDAEGDSLYYKLTTCYANGTPIFGFSYPPNMTDASMDHFTGDLVWCVPTTICQYNVAILIEEWKQLPGTSFRYYAGSILRDMQIDVASCNNTEPQIDPVPDTCIVANTNLHLTVHATDADNNTLSLSATGGPFLRAPAATFSSVSGIGTATGNFNWTPGCDAIQLLPYLVTFKATDNDLPVALVNFESVNIRVIAPAVTGLSATPSGSSIILNWTAPLCDDSIGINPLKGYLIYRKNACDPWTPGPCETGVPSYTGYSYIGTVAAPLTTFTDNNGGAGLTHGTDYSYIVVAYYADGSQSLASVNKCAKLVNDVPIITNVSVNTTGTSNDMWVHWVKPIGGSGNLDTLANPPPYEYRLMKAKGATGTLTFAQVASYTYSGYWQLTDTGYVNTGLNTQDSAYTYRVDFYCNSIFKGSTNTASSIYLTSSESDNTVNLSWSEYVPWNNYKYYIYRALPGSPTVFTLHDSTTSHSYSDDSLVNGYSYCYKILGIGQYSDSTLPRPLDNFSEIRCEIPRDHTPPCQPLFQVASDCGVENNVITWLNPNTYCSDDAVSYNIYFAPNDTDPLAIIYSTTDLNNTSYSHVYNFDGVLSVAGCYAVTAVDSFGNESPIVTKLCVDNCPEYELPNVFTPNGDTQNDLFIPLPYRYVKDVDITIYDRWGLVMFKTNDPDVKWDGSAMSSKAPCPDGTYFYVCTVNEIRLQGVVPRVLKGFVQLMRDKATPNR